MAAPSFMMGPAAPAATGRKSSSASLDSVSTVSTTSLPSPSPPKLVQFSKFVKVSYTYGPADYDRNPIEVEEMSSLDYYEFYQMQYQMYQTMKAEITLRQLGMGGVSMPSFEGVRVERPEDYFLSSRMGAAPTNLPQPETQTTPSMTGTTGQEVDAQGMQYPIHPELPAGRMQEQQLVY